MPNIVLKDLVVKYGNKKQISAVNFANCVFENKKINVILGKSGCGKTSLLRAILGLENYEGEIFFDDIDAKYLSIKERNIGYVSQKIALYPFKTLFNNIANPISNTLASGQEIRDRVNETARLLKIEECLSRRPKNVSIGQAQRAAIARALIKKPNLFIFDEAFSNLDQLTRDELSSEMLKIFKLVDATVIFVTHDIKEAFMFGEKIFVMDEGKIVDECTRENVLKSKNKITKELFKEYENRDSE